MTFENLKEIKEDLWTYLQNTSKNIVMYGTGNGADKIIDVLDSKKIPLYGIFASDDFARGNLFRGYTVKKYSDFVSELEDFIVIVSFATQRDDVLGNILKINSERELYAPDVPVYGEGIFDKKYFDNNRERLERIYFMLNDELSRKTFADTLAFKLTGKISYLIDCETSKGELNNLISSLITKKDYIDVGAYTGDTVEEYVTIHGNDMNIYAFEPDAKNYNKMLKRFAEKSIKAFTFNAAAWDKNELIRFYSNSGRAGSANRGINKDKYKDIQALRIDDEVHGDVGYIKIDAEGSELNVLRGMTDTILREKPCVRIAAYHRNEDYFAIPEQALEIENKFKIYMRHLKYIPGWDTDFIISYENS